MNILITLSNSLFTNGNLDVTLKDLSSCANQKCIVLPNYAHIYYHAVILLVNKKEYHSHNQQDQFNINQINTQISKNFEAYFKI